MSAETERAALPAEYLLHPLVLAMLALWALNDHVLKAVFANELTGKLSDVASLAVFPLLVLGVWDLLPRQRCARRRDRTRRLVLTSAVIATGAVMVLINTTALGAEAYRVGLGAAQWPFVALAHIATSAPLPPLHRVSLTVDPTDVLALPALVIPMWLGRGRRSEGQAAGSEFC